MLARFYHHGRMLMAFTLFAVVILPFPTSFDVQAATDLILDADAEIVDAQGDHVNVRDLPSYTGTIVTSLPEGSLAHVVDGPFTDEQDGSNWYLVVGNGQTGYMLADYLRTSPDDGVFAASVSITTARVNLRSGPGTDNPVLQVIPADATVDSTGAAQNGFTPVVYSGARGWVASQYLTGSSIAGSAITTARVNLRSGPGTNTAVLRVLPIGVSVTVTGAQQNGFLPVEFEGTRGFASATYLQQSEDRTATVTAGALNLRSGPGTTFSVLQVLPNGTTVRITGALQNGFYPVLVDGIAGFASADYLRIDGGPTPPVSTPGWTTANLNLRSAPSTNATIVLLMPIDSPVTITGIETSGFYPITFGNVSGFASSSYVSLTPPVAPPAPTLTPTPPTPPIPPVAQFSRTAHTIANLNLRPAANTIDDALLVIPNGSRIAITGELTGGFYPATFGAKSGFVSASYIEFSTEAIVWPFFGETWQILQGYNGSSHQNRDSAWQYLYSLDVARADLQTAGIPVFAPVSGTVRWYERASGGITIDMGNGYAFAMFHLTVDRKWNPGDTIQQGDFIGTVSPPGGEGYQQIPHIHLTLWQTNDGGNWNRHAAPFVGQFAISGNEFPSDGTAYQWSGMTFTP